MGTGTLQPDSLDQMDGVPFELSSVTVPSEQVSLLDSLDSVRPPGGNTGGRGTREAHSDIDSGGETINAN